jgi:hypothetical protein
MHEYDIPEKKLERNKFERTKIVARQDCIGLIYYEKTTEKLI